MTHYTPHEAPFTNSYRISGGWFTIRISLGLFTFKTAFLVTLATGAKGSELVALSKTDHNPTFTSSPSGAHQVSIHLLILCLRILLTMSFLSPPSLQKLSIFSWWTGSFLLSCMCFSYLRGQEKRPGCSGTFSEALRTFPPHYSGPQNSFPSMSTWDCKEGVWDCSGARPHKGSA